MDREQEKMSAMAAQQCANPDIGTMGASLRGGYANECKRASLRERVSDQLYRARSESGKCSRLEELTFLLEKNPEVARILDLIEEVRG